MFGFSLAELIVVALVAIIFIKPKDLPEIAHFFGKIFYRAKSFYRDIKASFKDVEKDLGLNELKDEFNRSIAEEKSKLEDDFTVILDMEGNEHRVPNISGVRKDLTEEELEKEIQKNNETNSNSDQKPSPK